MRPDQREELIREDMRDLHRSATRSSSTARWAGSRTSPSRSRSSRSSPAPSSSSATACSSPGRSSTPYGWPLVSVFVLCVAASMAELASAYPTAGGLYFWAYRLGGQRWAWTTAWFNMIGQVTITAGIDFAAAKYIVGAVNRIAGTSCRPTPRHGAWRWSLIMIPQMLINIFGIRLTARLNDFSVYWHIGGVLLIAALLIVFGAARAAVRLPASVRADRATRRARRDVHASAPWTFDSLMLRLPGLHALYASGGIGLGVRARPAAGAVDVHRLRRLGARRRGDGDGAAQQRLGRVPVGRRLGGRRLRDAARSSRCTSPTSPRPSIRPTRPAVLYIAYANLPRSAAHVVAIDHRRRDVAVRPVVDHQHEPHVVRLRARRRHAGLHADAAASIRAGARRCGRSSSPARWRCCSPSTRRSTPSSSRISTTALYLAYALPIYLNLRNKLRRRGEYTTPATRAVEPRPLGHPAQRDRGRVGGVHHRAVLDSAQRAGRLVDPAARLFMALYWLLDARRRFRGPQPTDGARAAPSRGGARRIDARRGHGGPQSAIDSAGRYRLGRGCPTASDLFTRDEPGEHRPMQPIGITSSPVAVGHRAAPGPRTAQRAWRRDAARARAPPAQRRAESNAFVEARADDRKENGMTRLRLGSSTVAATLVLSAASGVAQLTSNLLVLDHLACYEVTDRSRSTPPSTCSPSCSPSSARPAVG